MKIFSKFHANFFMNFENFCAQWMEVTEKFYLFIKIKNKSNKFKFDHRILNKINKKDIELSIFKMFFICVLWVMRKKCNVRYCKISSQCKTSETPINPFFFNFGVKMIERNDTLKHLFTLNLEMFFKISFFEFL